MEQPPNFIDKYFSNHVCHLHKAIYGLKQAPRAWFDQFSLHLLQIGFMCSKKDPSLFRLHYNHGTVLYYFMLNIIVTGDNPTFLSKFIRNVGSEFVIEDLGPLHYFLA